MITVKRVLSYVRRAVDIYHMIESGDKIAVGVSAGKDSLTLLYGLSQLRLFYPKKFELIGITLDCGFGDINNKSSTDFTGITNLCKKLNVEYYVIPVNIKQIVFDIRQEKNPCALCSNLRHGALNNEAKRLGCNKVALGHHSDDVVETFMLNIIYEGRIGTFSPVTYLDRSGLTLIRPLIYMPEKDIKMFAAVQNLPIIKNACPADKKTKREDMKILLNDLSKKYKNLNDHIFSAIERAEIDDYINPKKP